MCIRVLRSLNEQLQFNRTVNLSPILRDRGSFFKLKFVICIHMFTTGFADPSGPIYSSLVSVPVKSPAFSYKPEPSSQPRQLARAFNLSIRRECGTPKAEANAEANANAIWTHSLVSVPSEFPTFGTRLGREFFVTTESVLHACQQSARLRMENVGK